LKHFVFQELPLLHGDHGVGQAGIFSLELDPQIRIAHERVHRFHMGGHDFLDQFRLALRQLAVGDEPDFLFA
jgi:hypothetical protein